MIEIGEIPITRPESEIRAVVAAVIGVYHSELLQRADDDERLAAGELGGVETRFEPQPSAVRKAIERIRRTARASASRSLAFSVHAKGTWPDGLTLLTIDAQATFARVAPSAVTFDDVFLLHAIDPDSVLDEFTSDGTRAERFVAGTASLDACVPVGSGYAPGECFLQVQYSATEFVDQANLANFGVDAVQLGAATLCCTHCDAWGGDSCSSGFKHDCYAGSETSSSRP